jgi:hypothetical protein
MVQIRFAFQLLCDMVLEHHSSIIKIVTVSTATPILIDSCYKTIFFGEGEARFFFHSKALDFYLI